MPQQITKSIFILFSGILCTMLSSCDKEGCGETVISKNMQTESHKTGQDCMNCHQDGEGGEGCFMVAGSVYDSLQISPQANGYLILTVNPASPTVPWFVVEIDANGNFFTTENINWGDGLFAMIEGASGDVRVMNDPITSGDCNNCHGSSTDKIWVK